jgi:hypothetical protein
LILQPDANAMLAQFAARRVKFEYTEVQRTAV